MTFRTSRRSVIAGMGATAVGAFAPLIAAGPAAAAEGTTSGRRRSAATVLHDGVIFTGEPNRPPAQALAIGGVGVANTMIISVLERRPEIGLRRALGARRRQIRLQFLTEAVALSTSGGLAGVALGLAVVVVYATYQDWPLVVPLTAIAGGVAASIAIGALAGLYPATRASRLPPTEALTTG